MQILLKIWKKIEASNRVIFMIGGLFVMFLALITIIDVVARYFFNNPIRGSIELSELTMATVIFLCFGYSFTERAHISLEIVTMRLSSKLQLLLERITRLLTVIFLVLMMWQGAMRAISQRSSYTYLWHIPKFPFALLVSFGCALGLLSLIGHICFDSRSSKVERGKES
jgi:TRAP-type C4-dicarboxylate transport system permease small subunit